MASETNELTFVRCPTCRSLVPASASKCRICNATLDAAAKGTAADASTPSGGRVRQKTVSAGAEEVRNMTSASSPPPGPVQSSTPVAATAAPKVPVAPTAAAKAFVPPAASRGADDDVFDPLGAFLQDLDSIDDKSNQAVITNVPEQSSAPVDLFADDDISSGDSADKEDDLDDFDLDILEDPLFSDPLDVQPAPVETTANNVAMDEEIEPLLDLHPDNDLAETQSERSQTAPVASRPESKHRDIEPPYQDREPSRREILSAPDTRKPQNRDAQSLAAEEPRPSRPPTPARSGQSQVRPRIGGMPNRAEPKLPVKTNERTTDAAKLPAQRIADERSRLDSRSKSVQPAIAQHSVQPKSPPVAASGRNKLDLQQARPMPERPVQVAQSDGPRSSKMKVGRLFGWLVSYEHPDGRAIELRAGRFFVTGTSIRSTDLILEDQSISTPHALMSITENGLQLQDLMSERGTFVRCQGQAQYTREEGVLELQHGDWVRFGDVEFLITIVPG